MVRVSQNVIALTTQKSLSLVNFVFIRALVLFEMLSLGDVHSEVQDGEIVVDLRVNGIGFEHIILLMVNIDGHF